jgi:hypothetical protein
VGGRREEGGVGGRVQCSQARPPTLTHRSPPARSTRPPRHAPARAACPRPLLTTTSYVLTSSLTHLLEQPAHGLEPFLPRLQLSLQPACLLGGDRQLGGLLLLAREQLVPLRA